MNHPLVERTLKTGYPYSPKRESVGVDARGNEVLPGDEVLVCYDEFFLVEKIGPEAIEVLELLGATYEQAK